MNILSPVGQAPGLRRPLRPPLLAAIALLLLAASALADGPVVTRRTAPQYSAEAYKAKIEGTVVVAVEVGTDGRARNARIVKGLGYGLDARAMDSVRHWRFQPGTKNGAPVVTPATVDVVFHLADAAPRTEN